MASTQDLNALLDHSSWIHALARRLVSDPHTADDLAQDTLVAALEERPDTDRPLRGWLATVMRNRLGRLRRTETNRSARENDREHLRAATEQSAHDVVEKAATHRDVVLAVMELDEPYRSTILMRYFEQLSYREIARRMGVARATVNSRMTRGLKRLRQGLEATYGDRRTFLNALAPLALQPAGALTGTIGKLLSLKTMKLTIATASIALVTWTATSSFTGGQPEPGRTNELAVATSHDEPTTPEHVTLAREPIAERAQLLEQPEAAAAVPQQREKVQEKRQRSDEWKTELQSAHLVTPTTKEIMVNLSSGDVDILPSRSANLEIDATVRAELKKVKADRLTHVFEDHVKITEERGRLKIEDRHRRERGWDVSLKLYVPVDVPLSINTGSGDVNVRWNGDRMNVNTGSGDVYLNLGNKPVSKLNLNTGSGDVEIELLAFAEKGSLNANTGSGDVLANFRSTSTAGRATFNTGSGDVEIHVPIGVLGEFELESDNGEITVAPELGLLVEEQKDDYVFVRSTAGVEGGKFKLSSGSGDVELLGPATTTAK